MKSTLAAADSALLSSLSFELPKITNYSTDRQQVRYYPRGGASYGPNGVRNIRFSLTTDSFIDMASLVLQCEVVNFNPVKNLQPAMSSLAGFFPEVLCYMSGVETERISLDGRT